MLKIFHDSILGAGAYGTVCNGTYYHYPVAVKQLRFTHTPEAIRDLEQEAQILL